MVGGDTRLLYINQPHNPRGTARQHLQELRAARAPARLAGEARRRNPRRGHADEGLHDDLLERHGDTFEWVRPTASPIGFPRVNDVADVDEMCARLADMGVLLLPGSVYDQPAHRRIGFGRANMPHALHLLEACLGAPSTA